MLIDPFIDHTGIVLEISDGSVAVPRGFFRCNDRPVDLHRPPC